MNRYLSSLLRNKLTTPQPRTKKTLDNEQIIIAYSTLDALRAFEANASTQPE
ncbi:MAG: hypothetical protein OCD76_04195 [Reichenbachiella sp.]